MEAIVTVVAEFRIFFWCCVVAVVVLKKEYCAVTR